ncbi:MAG TPA: disulfide bond formation protein B [Candidatus Paceibacterota bacterium]|nr:disulfide bond formation protein B [Candidatus Paceibacterota bacterium]
MLATIVNPIWGALSVVALILSALLLAARFSPALRQSSFGRFFADKGLLVAFVVSLLATAGSLIYSDVIGYEPCKLCWFQRIFMYPQVILMGIALWKKHDWMKTYGLALSCIGAAIALYHISGQYGLAPLPCAAVGQSVSCAKEFVRTFGFITIPAMSFSAFSLIATTLWLSIPWSTPSRT